MPSLWSIIIIPLSIHNFQLLQYCIITFFSEKNSCLIHVAVFFFMLKIPTNWNTRPNVSVHVCLYLCVCVFINVCTYAVSVRPFQTALDVPFVLCNYMCLGGRVCNRFCVVRVSTLHAYPSHACNIPCHICRELSSQFMYFSLMRSCWNWVLINDALTKHDYFNVKSTIHNEVTM